MSQYRSCCEKQHQEQEQQGGHKTGNMEITAEDVCGPNGAFTLSLGPSETMGQLEMISRS